MSQYLQSTAYIDSTSRSYEFHMWIWPRSCVLLYRIGLCSGLRGQAPPGTSKALARTCYSRQWPWRSRRAALRDWARKMSQDPTYPVRGLMTPPQRFDPIGPWVQRLSIVIQEGLFMNANSQNWDVLVVKRGEGLRISLHYYNHYDDIDGFVDSISCEMEK